MKSRLILPIVFAGLALGSRAASADPAPHALAAEELAVVGQLVLPDLDEWALLEADERRAARGEVSHYAAAHEVQITPWNHGSWGLAQDRQARWRLRITSPGALSLSLAFSRYAMPEGGRLRLASIDGRIRSGPFTEADNEDHGELWTPPLPTGDLLLEVVLPIDRLDELDLELTRIHHGYAGFGENRPKTGDCHLDVACPEAEAWSEPARSVALISISGVRFCTGFLVNNTALDGRPLFMTARHCGVTKHNAASVVVMWGHQRAACGNAAAAEPGRTTSESPAETWRHAQTGAKVLASYRQTDMVLLELDDLPDPSFDVFYAGWDRSTKDPREGVAIHHPNTDFKRVSWSSGRAVSTRHLGTEADPGGNHLRVVSWDLGTTEGGSSGAPLFNPDKRVVGQLHGGHAACGNRRSDWFGRLSASWTGGGRPSARLSDWLDPIASGVLVLDGLDGPPVR